MRICPRCRSTYAEETDFCGIDGDRLVEQESDPLIGERIDRYEFVERLGGGAMGVVYRARHTELDRFFAIKVLYGEIGANKSLVGRFRREAQAVSKINHPNIIAVVDFGTTDNGLNFLVMENVDGETLFETLAREGALAPEHAAWITNQVAAGLGAAHRLGFVHRDVKPANVMLSGEMGHESVKLLDFGIVGITDGQHNTKLTGTGRIVGTPRYMSPEQARGSGVGPAADLYSLGVMLYEMLAGQVPFPGDVMADVLVLHSTEPPPPLPPRRGLERLAMWLLEKRSEDRPADASVVIDEIRKCVPELPLFSWSELSLPAPSIAPFDEDQIPTAKPHPAGEEILETPELASDLYDSAPDLVAPTFEHPRPSSDFDPSLLKVPRTAPQAAIFSTLGTGSDQLPAPIVAEARSFWGRLGPKIALLSIVLSLSAIGIVIWMMRTDDLGGEVEIAAQLQRAELRAQRAEKEARAAMERARQAELAAKMLVESSTSAKIAEAKPKPPRPRKKLDALSQAERELRAALRGRGLSHSDLQILPATKKQALKWLELRESDRERAARIVADLVERTKGAAITNQLLWKKFTRVTQELNALEKTSAKAARPLTARKLEIKNQLNQRGLRQAKRESIAKALTDLEHDIAKARKAEG
jgi:serine/threonine-protein kinase